MYVSTAGGAIVRHAGHPGGGRHHRAAEGERPASQRLRVAQDAARNLAANSLANAGRGNTSTGSAVSIADETVVPFSAFSHFVTGTTPVSASTTPARPISTSIAYNLPEGVSLGAATRGHRARRWRDIHVPVSIHGGAYGTARLFQQADSNQPLMLLAAHRGDLRGAGHALRELHASR